MLRRFLTDCKCDMLIIQCAYICRNKRTYADHDEYSALGIAMEDVKVVNGLECKMACNSSKVSLYL